MVHWMEESILSSREVKEGTDESREELNLDSLAYGVLSIFPGGTVERNLLRQITMGESILDIQLM